MNTEEKDALGKGEGKQKGMVMPVETSDRTKGREAFRQKREALGSIKPSMRCRKLSCNLHEKSWSAGQMRGKGDHALRQEAYMTKTHRRRSVTALDQQGSGSWK